MATTRHPAVLEFLSERARKGGKARLTKMTAEERTRVAKLAAEARWHKKTSPDPNNPQGTKRDKQGEGSGITSTRKPCRQTGVPISQPTLFEIAEPFENLEPLYARAA